MKKRSPYISNLPPRENLEDAKSWICKECKTEMNKDGRCANIAGNLCPKCYNKKMDEIKL